MTDVTRPIQMRRARNRVRLMAVTGVLVFIAGFSSAAVWFLREPSIGFATNELVSAQTSLPAPSVESQQSMVDLFDRASGQSLRIIASSSGEVRITSAAGDVGVDTVCKPVRVRDLLKFMDELSALKPNPEATTRLLRGETLTDAFLVRIDDAGLQPLLTEVQRHAAPNSPPFVKATRGLAGAPRRTIKRVEVSNRTLDTFVVDDSNPAMLRRFAEQLDEYGEFTTFFRPDLVTHGLSVRADYGKGELLTVHMNGWIPESWRVLLDEARPSAPK